MTMNEGTDRKRVATIMNCGNDGQFGLLTTYCMHMETTGCGKKSPSINCVNYEHWASTSCCLRLFLL